MFSVFLGVGLALLWRDEIVGAVGDISRLKSGKRLGKRDGSTGSSDGSRGNGGGLGGRDKMEVALGLGSFSSGRNVGG